MIKGSVNFSLYDKVFIVDLSWLLYKNYYKYKEKKIKIDNDWINTGHIYGTLSTLSRIHENYKNSLIILCQDGIPKDRINLYEKHYGENYYKKGRNHGDVNVKKDVKIVTTLLLTLDRIYLAYDEEKESDDLMYALAKNISSLKGFKGEIYIYSGDNDLLQAITENIFVTRYVGNDYPNKIDNHTLKTEEKFLKKFYGVDSYHLPYYRSIIGDSSDNIHGVYRFRKKVASEIAQNTESLDEIFTKDYNISEKDLKTIRENEDKIRFNYEVMKLKEFKVSLKKPDIDKKKIKKILEDNGLSCYLDYMNYR